MPTSPRPQRDHLRQLTLRPLERSRRNTCAPCRGVEKYVVMPDHVHILVRIANGPMRASAPTASLTKLIRSFKALCTKAAGHPLWQRGYYDHIIRDENDFFRCGKYLEENPSSWQERYPTENTKL